MDLRAKAGLEPDSGLEEVMRLLAEEADLWDLGFIADSGNSQAFPRQGQDVEAEDQVWVCCDLNELTAYERGHTESPRRWAWGRNRTQAALRLLLKAREKRGQEGWA